MRVIQPENLENSQFQVQEVLFLDCWHCFSHEKSLDSYRVKCLNARTIAQELRDEIELDILDDLEFESLAKEVSAVFDRDVILKKHFAREVTQLNDLIKEATEFKKAEGNKSSEKEKAETRARRQRLHFAISDLAALLERIYFPALVSEVKVATRSADLNSIPPLVNSILSDLVAQGWQLNNLWTWHKNFLNGRSFNENLEFLFGCLSKEPSKFKVALKITGGTSIRSIRTFGNLSLSDESSIAPNPNAEHEKDFAKKSHYYVFATGEYVSVDFRSAAIAARDELDPLLDALRFEFEPRVLSIDRHAMVQRESDSRTMLVELPNLVPNPMTPVDKDGFERFASNLSSVITSAELDSESRNKIKIAFRRFRTGRDSYKYSDKFLYWWMGLEALTNSSNKRIGRTVTKNTSYVMLAGYLSRIIDDFRWTIRSQKLDWKREFENVVQLGSWKYIDNHMLVQILRDPNASSELFQLLSSRTLIVERGKLLREWLTAPKSLANQLSGHLSRLQWHLDRLYRIRCCLVHGAPIRFKLALFAANLEYYLKETLSFSLGSFVAFPHVKNLDGLFVRTVNAWDSLLKELESVNANTDSIDRVLDFGVFPSVPKV